VFAILLHLFQLILDDDGLVNQMLKIWVIGVEQVKLDLIIETVEKHILLLLVSVDIVNGIPRQMNELIQVLIHHHTPLVQVREFLLLQLKDATGHVVDPEMSLELIPANSIGIEVGVVVSFPLVRYSSKQLMCYEEDHLTIGALRYL
jgi:hypothetical protein